MYGDPVVLVREGIPNGGFMIVRDRKRNERTIFGHVWVVKNPDRIIDRAFQFKPLRKYTKRRRV
jgi:hypothetical protein